MLTWKRSFALSFWYGSHPHDPLQVPLDAFTAELTPNITTSRGRVNPIGNAASTSTAVALLGDRANTASAVAFPYPPHLLATGHAEATSPLRPYATNGSQDHASIRGSRGLGHDTWRAHTDVQYELLRLAAGGTVQRASDGGGAGINPGRATTEAANGSGAAVIPEAALGRTRGCSPDVLDSLFPWLLLCLLRAIGQLAVGAEPALGAALSPGDATFAAVTMNAAATMQCLGEPYWAIYIAMHLPVRCPCVSCCVMDIACCAMNLT